MTEIKSIKCSSCGAPVKKTQTTCPFCGSHLDFSTPGQAEKIYGLYVTQIELTQEFIKSISKIFSYYVYNWTSEYFDELPKIIQVDKSYEKLNSIKDHLEKVFETNNIRCSLEVRERPGVLPLENPHCRHLLGHKLSAELIEKRLNSMSPVTISAVSFLAIFLFLGIIISIRSIQHNTYDPVKDQEIIDSITYPEETRILKSYSEIMKEKIQQNETRIRAPGSINIQGNPYLESIHFSYTYEPKKIKEIRFRFNLDYKIEDFYAFTNEFIKIEVGGGTTKKGSIIPPEKSKVNREKEIVHKEFTIMFSDYVDPMEYWNWLMKRPKKFPDIPGLEKKKMDKDDEIIDEDESGNPVKEKEIKKPEPIGREIIITFKAKRNKLAREVFSAALDVLKDMINRPEEKEKNTAE